MVSKFAEMDILPADFTDKMGLEIDDYNDNLGSNSNLEDTGIKST